VHAQFDRVITALETKLPVVAEHLEAARADILAFTAFPKEIWRQVWSNNPILVNRLSGDGLVLAA
jgi:putative transposase